MYIQYWPVGATRPSLLPLSHGEISTHLLNDWLPSFPATLAPLFFGWPEHLLEATHVDGHPHWVMDAQVRATERQWKGVLSWMLGVAGTRHVLTSEGYRWIAPLSAFYPGGRTVNTTGWHPNYPPGALAATADATVQSNLRPDYVAVRPDRAGGGHEFATAESKGTGRALTRLAQCPRDWYNQARNVRLSFLGAQVPIARHIVVATRCNPDAITPRSRRLQLRVWNSDDGQAPTVAAGAAAEIAAAHLFGLCRNLGLRRTAQALALATEVRAEPRTPQRVTRALGSLREARSGAEQELDSIVRRRSSDRRPGSGEVRVPTNSGDVSVELEPATVSLIRTLSHAESPEAGEYSFRIADEELDRSVPRRTVVTERGDVITPSGITIRAIRTRF